LTKIFASLYHPHQRQQRQQQQQQQHTHTLNMYLSEHELNAILQTPYYSQPFNTSFVNYTFYRGRYNANVLIVCFNVQNDLFNETFTSNSSDFQSFLDSGVGKLIFINLLYSFCQ
jgi:hypothetical protein